MIMCYICSMSIFLFFEIGKLLKLQCDVRADIRHAENNEQIRRHARYSTVFKQNELLRGEKNECAHVYVCSQRHVCCMQTKILYC